MLRKKTKVLDLKITELQSAKIESETLSEVLKEVKLELENLKIKQKSGSLLEINAMSAIQMLKITVS